MATVAVVPGKSLRNLNTLEMLKLSRVVLLGLLALLLVATMVGAHVHRAAMRTVGKDAAPSIVAAQHIKAALADMDADEANEMLASPLTANAATNGMAKRAPEADAALLVAAGNVTYEAEREPLLTLQVTGGIYNRFVEQAEDLHDSLPDPPDHVATPEVVNAYRADAIIMDNALLPAADDLDRANDEVLQRTYHAQATESAVSTAFVVLCGLAALGALIAMQLYLSRRTRRTLNPALALATVLVLGLFGYTLVALATEQHQLKIAKEDSFESIHALWRARAVGYEANAQESRFLLDRTRAADYARGFADDTHLLATVPAGMTFDQLVSEVTVAAKAGDGAKVNGFSGYLADELNNITFKGEQEAALNTLAAYGTYLKVDAEVRALEAKGQHEQAIVNCVGSQQDQAQYAFNEFDKALGETLAINEREFDRSVKAGLAAVGDMSGKLTAGEILGTLEFKAVVVLVLVAVLLVMGLGPRIREYD